MKNVISSSSLFFRLVWVVPSLTDNEERFQSSVIISPCIDWTAAFLSASW
ncbi:MAG: hypothetical protein LKE39_04330 [Sphaerochaeta sp.]|nr:hypothetical protein [Sphaerochaeta sp.]